jgi:hypothetical protein
MQCESRATAGHKLPGRAVAVPHYTDEMMRRLKERGVDVKQRQKADSLIGESWAKPKFRPSFPLLGRFAVITLP